MTCACGFYGTVTGGLAYALVTAGRDETFVAREPRFLAGSVLLSGRIILGETGVARAEYIRLESIFSLSAAWNREAQRMLKEVADLYQVPAYHNAEVFEDTYPLAPLATQLLPELIGALYFTSWKNTSVRRIKEAQASAHNQNLDTKACHCTGCAKRYTSFMNMSGLPPCTNVDGWFVDLAHED
jgi:hypothetical protein